MICHSKLPLVQVLLIFPTGTPFAPADSTDPSIYFRVTLSYRDLGTHLSNDSTSFLYGPSGRQTLNVTYPKLLVQLSLQLTPPFFSYHKQALPAGINAQPTAIKTAVPLGFVPIASVESSRHCSDTTHAFCLVEITRDVNQSKYFFLNNLGTTMKNLLINYAGAGRDKGVF
jgi:hypothetical protein